MSARLHGLVAEFVDPHEVLTAAHQTYTAGYRALDAYSPFLVEGLADAIGFHRNRVPMVTLIAGCCGGTVGYGMQCYAAIWDYPLNVGGRPLHSWPSFIPITFELTILFAAFGALFGMLVLNGLPRPNHPIFETPFFEQRSHSRFYLCILAGDPQFDRNRTRDFLRSLHPEHVWEVPDES